MKLDRYEMELAVEANDWPLAADIIRRNSTGLITTYVVKDLPVSTNIEDNHLSIVPIEIQVWVGAECWYWNTLQNFGKMHLTGYHSYGNELITIPAHICVNIYQKQ